jgi:hypothetical protein
VKGVSIFPLSKIFLLDFETVLTGSIFLFFTIYAKKKNRKGMRGKKKTRNILVTNLDGSVCH